MSSSVTLFLSWLGFFLTTIGGHLGFKAAIQHNTPLSALKDMLSLMGFGAILAWVLSAGFWVLIVSQQSVVQATSISNFRYPLICLAAIVVLGESMSVRQGCGAAIILIGLFVFRE